MPSELREVLARATEPAPERDHQPGQPDPAGELDQTTDFIRRWNRVADLVNAEIDRTRAVIAEDLASGKLEGMTKDLMVEIRCSCGATRVVPPANVPTVYRCPGCRASAAEPKERPAI